MFKSVIAALGLLVAAALPASAITLTPGDLNTTQFDSTMIMPGSPDGATTIDITNDTGIAINLTDIELVGVGLFDDVAAITFGTSVPTTSTWELVLPFSIVGIGLGELANTSVLAGETFSILFGGASIGFPVALSVGFDVAPIPLPATLPLLLAGVGAIVVMRRKAARA